MGSETFGIPEQLALTIKDEFQLSTFVESGTFMGGTSRWAAGHFEKVITVEASDELHAEVQGSFSAFPNILSLKGDSGATLVGLLPILPNSLFWLDAHWSAGNTAGEKYECPVLTELSAVMPFFHKHVIMIDDARYFTKPPTSPHKASEWPSLDDIFRVVHAYSQAYSIIYNDVIIVVPAVYRQKLTDIVHKIG